MTKFKRESLDNDLVRDIQQGDGPPIIDILRVTGLRYKFDISFINNATKGVQIVSFKAELMQVRFYLIPKGLVELIREVVTTRGLVISHGENFFL